MSCLWVEYAENSGENNVGRHTNIETAKTQIMVAQEKIAALQIFLKPIFCRTELKINSTTLLSIVKWGRWGIDVLDQGPIFVPNVLHRFMSGLRAGQSMTSTSWCARKVVVSRAVWGVASPWTYIKFRPKRLSPRGISCRVKVSC